MKILWIINAVISQIANECNLSGTNSGGWISAFLENLKSDNNYNLTVCFPYSGDNIYREFNGTKYISFCEKSLDKYDPSIEEYFENIILKEKPDVVHIFGTEFPHTLAAIKACKKKGILKRSVISIQGLISECAKEYYAGLPYCAVHRFSLRDLLKLDNVFFQKKSFEKRGKFEIEALKTAVNVIGRTDWDYKSVKKINNDINYFFCNESLRAEFYTEEKWSYDNCEKHSVFVPQSSYPLKGLHNLIKVFSEVVKKYPDTRIYTTGNGGNFNNWYLNLKHRTYYQKYLTKLINKHNLRDRITFLGNLNVQQMHKRLISSNVFVLASSLENSPNSLGEAMILGVPCVCSDVGGVRSLIKHNEDGYVYPFGNPNIVYDYIDKIFSDIYSDKCISKSAIKHAEETHSTAENEKTLKSIYSLLAKE